ncbi:hypothetical protein TQ39_10325 [Ruthenibacterium lactatiformans]|uniref:ATP synthase F(0) sector subunit c n=3 Tax=Ruthenibacterium lactatiformans TaxID=1550024 RepID=A0A0D8IZS1_9FIRM|nr:hypothetical protein TQ39_10325 [Ruthenibacterium lactatiformans]
MRYYFLYQHNAALRQNGVSVMKKMNVKKFARTFLVLIAVFALACAFSSMAFAADGETAAAAPDNNMGIGMIAAALAVGVAGIGAGIAVGSGAPAAIGALTEDPKSFGKALIFVVLGEGIALYGMLIAILIITKF